MDGHDKFTVWMVGLFAAAVISGSAVESCERVEVARATGKAPERQGTTVSVQVGAEVGGEGGSK